MYRHVTIENAKAMIGQVVTATGCCGMKDGIEVEGVLEEIQPCGDAIVRIHQGKKGRTLPCLANRNTLKLSPRVYN